MIEIRELKKNYGNKTVLSIESLKVNRGECVGLVGNNGAGKTTLLSLVLDLIKSTSGLVTSMEKNVSKSEDWKQYTGAFLNEGFLIPYLTPFEYFMIIAALHGKSKQETKNFLKENEAFFRLEEDESKYIRELSSGNKNKVGILAALFVEPEILILDEPFSNLDPSSQIWLKNMLKELNNKGMTIIISSHDLHYITDVCSRILLLENGIIVSDSLKGEQTLSELEGYFSQQHQVKQSI